MKNKIPDYIFPFFIFLGKQVEVKDTRSSFGLGDSFFWSYLRKKWLFLSPPQKNKRTQTFIRICYSFCL